MNTLKLPLREIGDWHVLEIRGERDIPGYDAQEVGKGLSEQAFRREVLGDWSATPGKLVYPEFGPIHISPRPLPFNRNLDLLCGWDFGGTAFTGTPAFVPTQINEAGQWLIYPPVIPSEDDTVGIYEMGEDVAAYLIRKFAQPKGVPLEGLKLKHFGDPAGRAKMPLSRGITNNRLELKSCYEILDRGMKRVCGYDERGDELWEDRPGWGWKIQGGEPTLKRMESLRWWLTQLKRGAPLLLVDPEATEIIEGFQGGYAYKQRSTGGYDDAPEKNWFSHILNALEYVASRIKPTKDEDEDDRPREQPWRSTTRAAGRRRPSW